MPKEYYLIDLTHNEKAIRREKIYELIARICLKYGPPGLHYRNFKDQYIYELWDHDDVYPTIKSFQNYLKISNIKWYIQNKIECKDKIWNADFIWGLAKHGLVEWHKFCFPRFTWYDNEFIEKIIRVTPFGGKFAFYRYKKSLNRRYRWQEVPALYLPHSEDSISYVAGVLAGGQPYVRNEISYARYSSRLTDYMKFLGIPIEETLPARKWILISPIWPALFSLRMPVCARETWIGLKNACNVGWYAPVLWRTYINNDFIRQGIPYLASRRKIYYKFKNKDGAMSALEKFRIEKNLVALDYRVRDIVKCWHGEKHDEKSKTSEENTK